MGKDGWVTVPTALKGAGIKKEGSGMLGPEEKRRIRLEAVAGEVLDVLGDVEWSTPGVDGEKGVDLEVRCLAWGYLALMYYPDVPRKWLREVMVGRYGVLVEFVEGFSREVLGEGETKKELPWVAAEDVSGVSVGVVGVAARFVRGVMGEVPWIGEQWSRWWTARKKREVMTARGKKIEPSGDLLLFAGAGLAAAFASAGIFFYRGLPPFGEAVQVWRKPVVSLSSFGAAGAILSGAFYGLD